jgi:Fe-S-cluster containining protein
MRSMDYETGKIVSDDFYFIKRHWKYLGISKDVGGFKYKGKHFEAFECEFVTKDNKCSINKNKPQICSGYPWYKNTIKDINESFPWPYKGCGYERISKERDLLMILIKIKEKKENEVAEEKTRDREINNKNSKKAFP